MPIPVEPSTVLPRTVTPLYAFGFGLSYTPFEFGKPRLKKATIGKNESTEVRVTVTNTVDETGVTAAIDELPALVHPRDQLSFRAALDYEVVTGFLWHGD